MELWAADTRGELTYHDEPLPSPALPLPSPKDLNTKPRMVLVRSPSSVNGSAEMLLTARELDELGTHHTPQDTPFAELTDVLAMELKVI